MEKLGQDLKHWTIMMITKDRIAFVSYAFWYLLSTDSSLSRIRFALVVQSYVHTYIIIRYSYSTS